MTLLTPGNSLLTLLIIIEQEDLRQILHCQNDDEHDNYDVSRHVLPWKRVGDHYTPLIVRYKTLLRAAAESFQARVLALTARLGIAYTSQGVLHSLTIYPTSNYL